MLREEVIMQSFLKLDSRDTDTIRRNDAITYNDLQGSMMPGVLFVITCDFRQPESQKTVFLLSLIFFTCFVRPL